MDTTLRPTGLALLLGAFVLTAGVAGTAGAAGPSKITPFERERGRMILNAIEDDLRKYYYDPAYHGLDVCFFNHRLGGLELLQPNQLDGNPL